MYVYESHLGGVYLSDEIIPFDALYCETCGDSDRLLGEVKDDDYNALRSLLEEHDYSEEYLNEVCGSEEISNENQ